MAASLNTFTRRAGLCCKNYASTSRLFSTSTPVFARRSRLEEDLTPDDYLDWVNEPITTPDTPTSGHLKLQEQRLVRHYLRLIENEMPQLVAFRKPFVPPIANETPLIVRSVDYVGENHPVQKKKTVVVQVDNLPLKDEMAKKRFILLAGPRWTPNPPTDAGVSKAAEWGYGFVKIACEDYPHAAQNLKWISDTLDKLIERANTPQKEDVKWERLPVDLRHVFAKARKAKKGEHLRCRILGKPSVRDFPEEWLPLSKDRDSVVSV